ncbi:hypothetical protein DFH07DRAFT_956952 [Mycena maculata]|uniref:Tc1-like transposase DDE domain-containing protein n=1 Tax=Mycena maculata TaxID=230809 RepID=A0AAD7JEW8_9AGAR|nr:hypothetical protein DFH07DRAFT_956952 [Mycena maculata]
MARTLDIPAICYHTGCKKRTVQGILEDYHKKWTVMHEHLKLEMHGAKRSMSTGDPKFLIRVVRHSPDIYLDELREMLEETRGHEVTRFYEFIDGLLDHMEPFPGKNSVIVMDNACIHKDPTILELIEGR